MNDFSNIEFQTDFEKGRLSMSRGRLVFEPVLQAIASSPEVWICTYNISLMPDALFDTLRGLGKGINLHIYTNIPGRNYGDKHVWRKKVVKYLGLLKPANFQATADVRFNFDNHSKVILTPTIGYVGSANFSSPSSKSFEGGVCSSDPGFLNTVRAFLEKLKETSIPFCHPKHIELGAKVLTFRAETRQLAEAVEDEYKVWNNRSGEMELRTDFVSFSTEVLKQLQTFSVEFEEWAGGLESDLDLFGSAKSLEEALDYFDNLEIPSREILIHLEVEKRSGRYVDEEKDQVIAEAVEAADERLGKILQDLKSESHYFAKQVASTLSNIDGQLTIAASKIAL